MTKRITNTKEALADIAPALVLHNLATHELGQPGGFIEQMEAQGQQELTGQTERLPSAGMPIISERELLDPGWRKKLIDQLDIDGFLQNYPEKTVVEWKKGVWLRKSTKEK